jgi:hypothetical protein
MMDDEDAPFPTVPGYTNHTGENLMLERQMHPNESEVERSKRLLRENVDGAASTIIEIALHGSTEKLRLDAAKAILDRVVGPVSSTAPTDDDGPLERMFKDLELAANDG